MNPLFVVRVKGSMTALTQKVWDCQSNLRNQNNSFQSRKNRHTRARRECDYGDFLARDLEKSTYISVITDVFSP
jgi:CHASE1-domain containing sensor protein